MDAGTFGLRQNRYRGESGHLFTGRFKSSIVKPGKRLSEIVDSIHLNPAKAKLVESAKSAPWKLAIVARLKSSTSVSSMWLSRELHMVEARGVSSNLCVNAKRKTRCPHYRKLKDLTIYV